MSKTFFFFLIYSRISSVSNYDLMVPCGPFAAYSSLYFCNGRQGATWPTLWNTVLVWLRIITNTYRNVLLAYFIPTMIFYNITTWKFFLIQTALYNFSATFFYTLFKIVTDHSDKLNLLHWFKQYFLTQTCIKTYLYFCLL